jgi:GWxTD domain-containing protein
VRLGILLRGRPLLVDWRRPLVIPPFPAPQRQLSEPVFLTTGSTQPFPARVYEETDTPRVQCALWAPAADSGAAPIAIIWRAVKGDVERASGRVTVPAAAGTTTPFALQLPQLPPGTYDLLLEVPTAESTTPPARAGRRWYVVPRIAAAADSLPTLAILEVLLPAATFATLEQASAAERLLLWQAALQDLAPGPPAVALDLLQDRWQQASLRFIEGDVPGWRTARGRVYIRRGDPDEVDNLADPVDHSRIERWRYRQDNHVFVFRDGQGSGVYVLERTNDDRFP